MATGKLTTGLTGLKVVKYPHRVLGVLYGKIERCLERFPEDAAYRKYTAEIISHRHNILKSEPDITKVEEKIGAGQVEELIVQAENELFLARKMLNWKPWEPLVKEPPPNQWKWPI
ncbi:UNVERIFIED_CONTAM: hypothetical protein RMT77_013376 [Armadillidium vulgare]|nr:NADH dehydrogenase [ubiquinone] 1 alpha subcomplex subunit 5 [Armadillidium vulgare]RXG59099.1 NADH dehydrogenase [ubiquinone] 1 alpha subcomplex subunit 5 [Armadillidium vulgare]